MREALDIAIDLVKGAEGCKLTAYPDPGTGGAPWTIGYGETLGVKPGMVWTQEYADAVVRMRVAHFMAGTYGHCPQLHLEPPERVAACTSLAYNIGLGAFSASSVCRLTKRREYAGAADAFLLWNKSGGRVMRGLTIRRQLERKLYLG